MLFFFNDTATTEIFTLSLHDALPICLVGLGFGGWVAAEMAALAPRDFHRLVLVGAMGVKPPEGDIFDQAIVSYRSEEHTSELQSRLQLVCRLLLEKKKSRNARDVTSS